MFIDKKTDVAYILLNAEDSNKKQDGSHDYRAERFDIKYFIRSGKCHDNFTDQTLSDHLTPTTTLTGKVTVREEDRMWS